MEIPVVSKNPAYFCRFAGSAAAGSQILILRPRNSKISLIGVWWPGLGFRLCSLKIAKFHRPAFGDRIGTVYRPENKKKPDKLKTTGPGILFCTGGAPIQTQVLNSGTANRFRQSNNTKYHTQNDFYWWACEGFSFMVVHQKMTYKIKIGP